MEAACLACVPSIVLMRLFASVVPGSKPYGGCFLSTQA